MKISSGIVSGSQIITEKGDENIEYLNNNDKVLNSFGNFTAIKSIVRKIYRGDILTFNFKDKPSIQSDVEHMFYSKNDDDERVFVHAKDLRPGSELCRLGEYEGRIYPEWIPIRSINRSSSSIRWLYGLDVEDGESYTVNGYIVRSCIK